MKQYILLIIVILAWQLSAKEVKPEIAGQVAINKLQNLRDNSQNISLQLFDTKYLISSQTNEQKRPLYYVFTADNAKAFVIVSADDNARPILGYSLTSSYDKQQIAPNFMKWMENYKKQLEYIIVNHVKASAEIKNEWNSLINNTPVQQRSITSVNPLVTTTWSQSPYYNDMCPADSNAGAYNGYHAVAGCPATAMGQIMKYWNYPAHGTGFHSYNHPTYGTLSANFAATTYDWAAMPNNVTSANNAVATLLYHCGVGVEMGYGPTESGSYVIIDNAYYSQERTSEYAFKTYFGYDAATLHGVKRENYSDASWIQLLKNELNAGRPIQYAGFGAGGGHTFVCDGYDSSNYFHMNWGWSGMYDGFFILDALSPGTGGTGAGAGAYNDGQQALIGIQPPTSQGSTSDIRLYDYVTNTPTNVPYGQAFSVHTNVGNWGSDLTGDFCAAIFDSNYNFVDFVGILSGLTLRNNSYFTNGLTFNSTGIANALPGTYYIGIFYRPSGGDWAIAGNNGSYTNMIQFRIIAQNNIELYQNISLSCGTTITQNQPFTVYLNVENTGTTTFTGDFNVSLYRLDGSFAAPVQTLYNGTLNAGYHYNGLQFTTSGINIAPGTYYLALFHKPAGGNWILSGSTRYANPIYVTVRVPQLQADIFENNDAAANAYSFLPSFSNGVAHVQTTGANLHIASDNDYYRIDLPSGYDYTITARAHDKYSAANGQTYSCDVAWGYYHNNAWSSVFDDVMQGNITVHNGGTIYFFVGPYFTGSTGTYLLDINISRSTSGIDGLENTYFSFYPNPVKNKITLSLKGETSVKKISVINTLGQEIFKINKPNFVRGKYAFDLSGLHKGVYMLLLKDENHVWQEKLIKSD